MTSSTHCYCKSRRHGLECQVSGHVDCLLYVYGRHNPRCMRHRWSSFCALCPSFCQSYELLLTPESVKQICKMQNLPTIHHLCEVLNFNFDLKARRIAETRLLFQSGLRHKTKQIFKIRLDFYLDPDETQVGWAQDRWGEISRLWKRQFFQTCAKLLSTKPVLRKSEKFPFSISWEGR